MDTTDVIYNGNVVQEDTKRFSVHLFHTPSPDPRLTNGTPLRVPADMSTWPPDVLFDAVYASAILRHFGQHANLSSALALWEDRYYPLGAKQPKRHISEGKYQTRIEQQSNQRDKRAERRLDHPNGPGELDELDTIMLLPYMFQPPENAPALFGRRPVAVAARERSALNAKVNSWRTDVSTELPDDDP